MQTSHTADDVTLDTLPAGCRIWVFAANRPLDDAERARIAATLLKAREKWGIKQPGMRGCHAFVEDRFAIVGADEAREMLDGCSVDAMIAWVMRLEAETGLRLMDRMTVHFRDEGGAVRSCSRAEFAGLAKRGAVTAATPVFDTTISRVDDWRAGRFEVPAAQSWHGAAFGL